MSNYTNCDNYDLFCKLSGAIIAGVVTGGGISGGGGVGGGGGRWLLNQWRGGGDLLSGYNVNY